MNTITQLHPPQHPEPLPHLSIADRVALRIGVALILWSDRHADRDAARRTFVAEQARASREAEWQRLALLAPRR